AVAEERVERRPGRGPPKGQARGLEAATPLAREHAPDRDSSRGERGAHAARLGAALLREVALGGALVQAEARRVAERAVGRRVAHDDDLAAGAQERPQRLVSGGQAWRRQGLRGVGEVAPLEPLLAHPEVAQVQRGVVAGGAGADDDHAARRADEYGGRQRRLARVLEDDPRTYALAQRVPERLAERTGAFRP